MKKYSICLVGATGLVGQTFLKIIESNNFPLDYLTLYASEKSEGKMINFKGKELYVNKLDDNFSPNEDFVVFMTNSKISDYYAKKALKNGKVVIDNSDAFRMKEDVPIIIPCINKSMMKNKKLISNPNCVVAICSIPLFFINQKYRIERINLTTFQSVSGSGKNGLNELELTQQGKNNYFYKSNIALTCIPEIGEIKENLYTEEECKIADEINKISNNYVTHISSSCVRVPVKFCHLICCSVTFKDDFNLNKIEEILKNNNEIEYIDRTQSIPYPTQDQCYGRTKIFVGRLRKDTSMKNTVLFFVAGDNLMRGSSYNAYDIISNYIKVNDSF